MLYATQMSRHRSAATSTTNFASDMDTPLSDLDEIAAENRDMGQLEEPLADSVLEYGLRKLTSKVHSESSSLQDLATLLYRDDLSQLLDESMRSSSVPMPAPETMIQPSNPTHSAEN